MNCLEYLTNMLLPMSIILILGGVVLLLIGVFLEGIIHIVKCL